MFEAITETDNFRTEPSRKAYVLGAATPIVLTILCLAWSAVLSHQKQTGVLGAPFAVWVLGLTTFGLLVSLFAGYKLKGTTRDRLLLGFGIWVYIAGIAACGAVVGFFVVWAAAGAC